MRRAQERPESAVLETFMFRTTLDSSLGRSFLQSIVVAVVLPVLFGALALSSLLPGVASFMAEADSLAQAQGRVAWVEEEILDVRSADRIPLLPRPSAGLLTLAR